MQLVLAEGWPMVFRFVLMVNKPLAPSHSTATNFIASHTTHAPNIAQGRAATHDVDNVLLHLFPTCNSPPDSGLDWILDHKSIRNNITQLVDKLDPDKENRLPARMAARQKSMAKQTNVRPSHGTPGRKARPGNQYFEVGKVGRKTGITLKDTGIRDDYGLEPVSGIFSSPASAQRHMYADDGSADMDGLNSSIPDVNETIRLRRTPRLPPARASTPRRSNISGSPRRQSSARPSTRNAAEDRPPATLSALPANRKLDFNRQGVRESIEKKSPFKPTHTLRRSGYAQEREITSNGDHQRAPSRSSGVAAPSAASVDTPDSSRSKKRYEADANPLIFFDDDDDENEPLPFDDDQEPYADGEDDIEGALGLAGSLLQQSPTTPRRKTITKRSDPASDDRQAPSSSSTSRKRPRQSLAAETQRSELQASRSTGAYASEASPSSSKKRARIAFVDEPAPTIDYDEQGVDEYSDDSGGAVEFEPIENDNEEPEEPRQVSQPPRQKKSQAARKKGVAQPRRERTTSKQPSKVRQIHINDDSASDSENSDYAPVRRQGSVSNVALRAVTPFEDAGENKTRSGRLVMKPLNYWAGEAVVWRNGEVDGVVRASSVEPQKRVYKKRPPSKKKGTKKKNTLGAIDERDEELLPSDWEEEVGVLTGQVAEWDRDIGMGNDEILETEDIAFAASAIITRQVQGASFNYAKIQTLPFFGSGIVEIPPGGFKATKNSRKMQMNFFVHKGKVTVTVATPRPNDGSEPTSTTEFGITEGGAWIVPRGNNYTIRNLSTTTTAYIFFSQGCEVEETTEINGGDA